MKWYQYFRNPSWNFGTYRIIRIIWNHVGSYRDIVYSHFWVIYSIIIGE